MIKDSQAQTFHKSGTRLTLLIISFQNYSIYIPSFVYLLNSIKWRALIATTEFTRRKHSIILFVLIFFVHISNFVLFSKLVVVNKIKADDTNFFN
jgi:hypothetical protein